MTNNSMQKCVPNLLVRRISKLWIINEVIIRVGLLSTDDEFERVRRN